MWAVTGASGFIGTGFTEFLAGEVALRVITRSDLEDDAALANKLQGCDTLFHLVGLAHQQGATRPDAEAYDAVNVGILRRVLDACARADVGHVIVLSSLAVYMQAHTHGVLNSDSPTHPDDVYGKTKLAGDDYAQRWALHTGRRVTIVRPPLVYGAGAKGNLPRLMRLASLGIPLPFGLANAKRSFIARENLCDALYFIAHEQKALPKIICVRDARDRSLREWLVSIARAGKKRVILLPIPAAPLKWLLHICGRSRLAHQLFSRLTVEQTLGDYGWEPPSDGEADLTAMVRQYHDSNATLHAS